MLGFHPHFNKPVTTRNVGSKHFSTFHFLELSSIGFSEGKYNILFMDELTVHFCPVAILKSGTVEPNWLLYLEYHKKFQVMNVCVTRNFKGIVYNENQKQTVWNVGFRRVCAEICLHWWKEVGNCWKWICLQGYGLNWERSFTCKCLFQVRLLTIFFNSS